MKGSRTPGGTALKQNGAITTATKGTREARERKNERKKERGKDKEGRGAREQGEAKKAWRVKATCRAKTTRFNETMDTSGRESERSTDGEAPRSRVCVRICVCV